METLFGKLIVSVLGVSLIGGVAVSNLKPNTPIIKEGEIIVIQENKRTPKEEWLDFVLPKLIQCESGGNSKAVGDSGSARGILQFHKNTFIGFALKYNLYPNAEKEEIENFYLDSKEQIKLATLILTNEKNGWRHWTNCFNKLKLPKNENAM